MSSIGNKLKTLDRTMQTGNNKYYYPIVLKNKRLNPFYITSDIVIRKITESEREEFFGLQDVEFIFMQSPIGYLGFKRLIKSNSKKGRYSYDALWHRGMFDGSNDVLASNYVIVINNVQTPDDIVQRLNLSLKIFQPTSTGGYLGFKEKETDVHFHFSMPVHGPYDYLAVKQTDLKKIQQLFLLMDDKWGNDKFKLLITLFDRALQGGKAPLDIRFLLLVIALECLYLPKQETEATFRLSVRVANLLEQFGYGKAKNIYKEVKNIYNIRSRIVHSGNAKNLTYSVFSFLTDVVRKSLMLYIQNPDQFTDDALTNIVL